MTTAVLLPQDCTSPIALVPRSNPACGRKPNSIPNSRRRRRSPSNEKRTVKDQMDEVNSQAQELVMGKVKILKRGDKLSPDVSKEKTRIDRGRSVTFEKVEAAILCSTDRLESEPVVTKELIRVCEKKKKKLVVVEDKFAGCVVVASPPPTSLPMPNKFWMKRDTSDDAVSMAMDLRRMLRLDLL